MVIPNVQNALGDGHEGSIVRSRVLFTTLWKYKVLMFGSIQEGIFQVHHYMVQIEKNALKIGIVGY